ncbi:hypothetical protein [Aporhodopirellula aestuarii]|uniref:Uncharacterized protein n=1 Tax=Aporhodopirellula aestuarii TaxID=2950107 RepID=A0ABT0UAX2_9BACT|nr:hypothetical protein [Aporhodopirellula aestuarii]MCM2373854.1 hypothetical protein [Aporhodopirellula aestuarii]
MKFTYHQVALGLLALMTLGGCASINDCCYEKTQTMRAVKEYVKCGKPECSSYPHDYKCGWIDGFYEVATGGDSCPPAIAPARYWKPGQILKDCDNRRYAYYSGWQDGASRASQFPDTHYLRIYETCECPFPRCDKPCGDGACGPCGSHFIGISASAEMIEAAPYFDAPEDQLYQVAPHIEEHMEDIDVDSNSNKQSESDFEPLDATENLPAPRADDSTALPLPQPKNSEKAEVAESAVGTSVGDSDEELVSIPGRIYQPASTESKQRETSNAQQQGVIRLVTSAPAQIQSSPLTADERIVVVGSSDVRFEMIEIEPVVKLAK